MEVPQYIFSIIFLTRHGCTVISPGYLMTNSFSQANIHNSVGIWGWHAWNRKSPLMLGRYAGSWRMLCHSRYSLHSLSRWRGFSLELQCVCTHTLAFQSAGSSVGEKKCLLDIGRSHTLGLLQRSSLVTFLFAPRRNRRIYRRYVFQPTCVPLLDRKKFKEQLLFASADLD